MNPSDTSLSDMNLGIHRRLFYLRKQYKLVHEYIIYKWLSCNNTYKNFKHHLDIRKNSVTSQTCC